MCETLGLEKIAETEAENVKVFLEEIAVSNKELKKMNLLRNINVWGDSPDQQSEMKFGSLFLNIYVPGGERFDAQNKSYIHPELVS